MVHRVVLVLAIQARTFKRRLRCSPAFPSPGLRPRPKAPSPARGEGGAEPRVELSPPLRVRVSSGHEQADLNEADLYESDL